MRDVGIRKQVTAILPNANVPISKKNTRTESGVNDLQVYKHLKLNNVMVLVDIMMDSEAQFILEDRALIAPVTALEFDRTDNLYVGM